MKHNIEIYQLEGIEKLSWPTQQQWKHKKKQLEGTLNDHEQHNSENIKKQLEGT